MAIFEITEVNLCVKFWPWKCEFSIAKKDKTTKTMSEQQQQQMAGLVLEEKSITSSLNAINKSMGNLLNKKYGMKEDTEFIVPLKPSKEKVRMLDLKRARESDEVHANVRKVQKLLLKINEGIGTVQKTTYQYLITKKRQRDLSVDEKNHRKKRKEEVTASRLRQSALNTVSNVSLSDLQNDMERSDDDEFEVDLV